MPTLPGNKVFATYTPLTTALSPFVSGWIDTTGYTQVFCWGAFAGGTTVVTVEGSFDGTNLDTDAAYAGVTNATFTTPATFAVISTFIRVRIVQTVADATKTKIFMQARA